MFPLFLPFYFHILLFIFLLSVMYVPFFSCFFADSLQEFYANIYDPEDGSPK